MKLYEKLVQLNSKVDSYIFSGKLRKLRITIGVFWNLALILCIFFITAIIFFASVGTGYFASLVKDEKLLTKEEMEKLIYNYEETSEMYFAENIYIGKIRSDLERQKTTLENVSPKVIDAVLATEDELFYEHNGIVPKAVIRGLLQDVTNSSTQTGGSTLTQQLVKNQILTNEVSYERKARELLLAMRVEKFFTKEEILEVYLNIIPYGRNASGRNIAGVETAAQGIFGISASKLNLPQAAYIAGLPQAPFAYTPFTKDGKVKDKENLKPGIDRMKTVLYRMKEVGYITEEEYKEAIKYDITKDFRKGEKQPIDKYPWLTIELENRAKRILAEKIAKEDGVDPKRLEKEEKLLEKYTILADRDLRSKGYRIYSTIDKKILESMEKAAKDFQYYGHTFTKTVTNPETGKKEIVEEPVQVGSIMIENSTGKILGFVGGRDFKVEQLNHATQAYRSNGSTMKPLLVYAPAIEYGKIGAGSPVVDVKFNYRGYRPSNFTASEERGIIPARVALAYSQNLTALRLYDSIMDKKPISFLEKMKFSKLIPSDGENLSTAIGALTYGTTVEENTNAFATFANGGKFIDSYMIEKIEDADGNLIYKHKVEPVQVFSPETSYIITDMLRDVLKYGTGTKARNNLKFSSDFAAKTGTSQQFKDVWLVGYNPNISLGVWLGYDSPRSLKQYTGTYDQPSVRVNLLWAKIANATYDVKPDLVGTKKTFSRPANVIYASFCGISGNAPSKACANAGFVKSDLFNRNVFVPTKRDDSFKESKTVQINGKNYLALDSTPKEFVNNNGFVLNPDFAKRMLGRLGGDPSKLIKTSNGKSISTAEFQPISGKPDNVQANLKGNTITWNKSSSKDVVGYRIYQITDGGRKLVKTLKDTELKASVSKDGEYVVVAVDITGKESSDSNIVSTNPENQSDSETTDEENNTDDKTGKNDNNEKDKKNKSGNNNEKNNNNDNKNQSVSNNKEKTKNNETNKNNNKNDKPKNNNNKSEAINNN